METLSEAMSIGIFVLLAMVTPVGPLPQVISIVTIGHRGRTVPTEVAKTSKKLRRHYLENQVTRLLKVNTSTSNTKKRNTHVRRTLFTI